MKYYLGLDCGGTTIKAALFTAEGKEAGVARSDTALITPRPDFIECDMEQMWKTICALIQKVLAKSGVANTEIAGVGICGHGKGLYLWGNNNAPIRNGILSSDNRAFSYPIEWEKAGIKQRLFERSCQNILACQPPALLAWIRDNEPDVYRNIKWIFECKDYIRFRLTGQAYAELTDYSGSSLLNLRTGTYDDELLKLFGLEAVKDALPPLCRCDAVCGAVTAESARLSGLSEGTPVIGGMFDIDACALAAGVIDESTLSVVAGTWSVNGYIQKEPVLDGSIGMNSFYCLPGYYFIEESSPTSAGNLNWIIQELFPELIEKAEQRGQNVYKRLDEKIAAIAPEEYIPLYIPFLMGSNMHPNAKACFMGMNAAHKRIHLLRSVYEGIVFCHRVHIDRLIASSKVKPSVVRLTGGAANSAVWAQMFADVLGLPVETVDARETGALGCVMAISFALGDTSSLTESVKKMCRVSARFMPNLRHKASYDKRYAVYKKAASSLDSVWDDFQVLIH